MIHRLTKTTKSVKLLYYKCKRFAKVIDLVGSITYEPYSDPYSFLVNTIIGQMLSNKVADIMSERLIKLCNGKVTVTKITKLSNAQIKSIGISNSKVKFIKELTSSVKNKTINFYKISKMNDEDAIKELTNIHGIGTWSAKMYLIFVLNRQDILPYEDMAFIQGYKWCYRTSNINKESITKKFKKFIPYRSIAARYLYKALDSGYTKIKI